MAHKNVREGWLIRFFPHVFFTSHVLPTTKRKIPFTNRRGPASLCCCCCYNAGSSSTILLANEDAGAEFWDDICSCARTRGNWETIYDIWKADSTGQISTHGSCTFQDLLDQRRFYFSGVKVAKSEMVLLPANGWQASRFCWPRFFPTCPTTVHYPLFQDGNIKLKAISDKDFQRFPLFSSKSTEIFTAFFCVSGLKYVERTWSQRVQTGVRWKHLRQSAKELVSTADWNRRKTNPLLVFAQISFSFWDMHFWDFFVLWNSHWIKQKCWAVRNVAFPGKWSPLLVRFVLIKPKFTSGLKFGWIAMFSKFWKRECQFRYFAFLEKKQFVLRELQNNERHFAQCRDEKAGKLIPKSTALRHQNSLKIHDLSPTNTKVKNKAVN